MADFDSSLPVRTKTDGDIVSKITDGTNNLEINSDGSINANIIDSLAGAEVHVFRKVMSGIPNTENTVVNYTVTVGKTLQLKAIQASASGKFKFELKTGPSSSESTRVVGFGSTPTGTIETVFPQSIEVVAGNKVLLIITNKDQVSSDVYGFINGNEI